VRGGTAFPLRHLTAAAAAAAVLLGGCSTAQRPSLAEPTARNGTTPRTTALQPVVTRDGPCPYFTTSFAVDTVGQHLSRSTVTTTTPYPGCTFYRPDEGKAVDVQVSVQPTVLAAQRRAVTLLGPAANPVSGVGDHGTVVIVADGARLAVSKGRVLIVVWVNQQVSLQARDIAAAVAAKVR
jgi:hypothetical protein